MKKLRNTGVFVAFVVFVAYLQVGAQDDPLSRVDAEKKLGKVRQTDIVSRYADAIARDPKNPASYVSSAYVYRRAESLALFEKALQVDPHYLPALVGRARYSIMAAPPKVFSEYKAALALPQADQKLLFEAVHESTGYVSDSDYPELLRLASQDVAATAELIEQLAVWRKFDRAHGVLQSLPPDETSDPRVVFARSSLLFQEADAKKDEAFRKQALELMSDAWHQSPSLIKFYVPANDPRNPRLATLLNTAGRQAESIAVLEKGIELYPQEFGIRQALWKLWFSNPKQDYSKERQRVRLEAAELFKREPISPELLAVVSTGYAMAGDDAMSARINRQLLSEFPYSDQANHVRLLEIEATKDPKQRAALMPAYIADFNELHSYYFTTLDDADASPKELRVAADLLLTHTQEMGYPITPDVLSISNIFLRRGIDIEFVDGLLNRTQKNPDELLEGSNLRPFEVMPLACRAKILLTRGDSLRAEAILRRLLGAATKLQPSDRGYIMRFLGDALVVNKKPEEALDLYAQAVGEISQSFEEAALSDTDALFHRVYREVKGTDTGSDEFLAARTQHGLVATTDQREARVSEPSPDFSLLNLQGQRVSLTALRGKVVIVNFWATWCAPCRREFPELQALYDETRKNKSTNVEILAISTDENRALVEPFIKSKNYTFPVLFDEGAKAKFKVGGIPATFIIDPEGRIRHRIEGFNAAIPFVPHLRDLISEISTRTGVSNDGR